MFCAHWVTPSGMPRIFDTRFFLASLPPGQEPDPDAGGELTSMRWVAPGQALREAASWVGCDDVRLEQVEPAQYAPRLAAALVGT